MKITLTKKSEPGFSLLELLLVIVIIGIMSLYFANTVHKRDVNATVEQTVSELTSILQAATNYYLLSGVSIWPQDIISMTTNNNILNTALLAPGIECSPWPNKNSSSNCQERSEYEVYSPGGEPIYFAIKVQVPSQEIAKRIQGKLPLSVYKEINSLPYLLAYTPAPQYQTLDKTSLIIKEVYNLQQEESNSGGIIGLGIFSAGHQQGVQITHFPACPSGWQAAYAVAHRWWFGNDFINLAHFQIGHCGSQVQRCTANSNEWWVAVKTDVADNTDPGAGDALVITYCVPPPIAGRAYDPQFDYYQ